MQAFLALAFAASAALSLEFSEISISVKDALANEGDASIKFFAELLHNGNSGPALWTSNQGPRFLFNTEDGSAQKGKDFVSSSGVFSFPTDTAGSSHMIAVPLIDDIIAEKDSETFELHVSVEPSLNLQHEEIVTPAGPATGTIIDNEGLSIQLDKAYAVEGADTHFTFDITLSHTVDEPFPVFFSTLNIDGHAESDVDYVSVNNKEVVLTPGSKSSTFQVEIIDDHIQEDVETFEVLVRYVNADDSRRQFSWSPSNTVAGEFSVETEGVTVCIAPQIMAEGSSKHMVFQVELSHELDTSVSVALETTDGTAVAQDSTSSGEYIYNTLELVFPERSTASLPFNVGVVDDNIQSSHTGNGADFPPINFNVEFSVDPAVYVGSTGGAINAWNVAACGTGGVGISETSTGTTLGEIYDFEDVTISLEASATSLSESSSDNFSFTVTLSHQVLGGSTQDTTALGAQFYFLDYNPGSSDTFYGASVSTGTQSSMCSSLPAFGDSDMPANGPVDICWPYDIIPKNVGNNKPEPVSGPTILTFSQNPGEIVLPYIATFDMGPTDYIIEGDETFKIGVAMVDGVAANYGIRTATGEDIMTTTVTLVDDEPVSFTFTPTEGSASQTVAEATEGDFVYTVALSHTSSRAVEVEWNTFDGSAVEGSDYYTIGDAVLVWPAFSDPETYRTAVSVAMNDNVQEKTETFTVEFSDAKPTGMFPDFAAVSFQASITDDEGLTISINDMTEAMDESSTQWAFTVTMSHESDFDQTISYSAVEKSGSANPAAASRFVSQVTELVIPSTLQETVAQVEVVNDNVQTGTVTDVQEFDVQLYLATAPEIKLIGSKTEGTMLVSDDEGVEISITDGTAIEGVSPNVVQFMVALSHQVTEAVAVTYSTVSSDCITCATGSASGGSYLVGESDYTSQDTATFTMPAYVTSNALPIAVINDNVQEYSETFMVSLTEISVPADSGFIINADNQNATATLYDDEEVKISIGNAKAQEGGVMVFTVKLTHSASTDVVIEYELFGGSAEFPADFNSISHPDVAAGTVIVPAQSKEATITIQSVDDNIAEKAETFTVQLLALQRPTELSPSIVVSDTSAFGLGTIGSTTTFDEGVTIAVSAVAAVDRGEAVQFDIKLSHEVAEDVRVQYSTQNLDAEASVDYTPAISTKVFRSGSVDESVLVETIPSACQQRQVDRKFKMEVSNPTGFRHTGVVSAVGVMTPDDHEPTVSIVDAASNEGQTMQFTVTLSHCVSETLFVQLGAVSGLGSAIPGADFLLPSSKVVSFPANQVGSSTATFDVTVNNDNVQGSDSNFFLDVSGADAPNNNAGAFGVTFPTDTSRAEGVVQDDEDVTLSITQVVAQDPHVNDEFTFTVSLSHRVQATISLDYTTGDLTAVAGQDYVPTEGKVTFPHSTLGDHLITVTVTARDDVVQPGGPVTTANDVVPPTGFAVTLTPTESSVLEAYRVAFAEPQFGNPNGQVGRGAIYSLGNTAMSLSRVTGTEGERVLFTATISDTLGTDVVVGYKAVRQTADAAFVAEYDLIGYDSNFTFYRNQGPNQQQSFTIDFYDDDLVEENEYFDVDFVVISPEGFTGTVINFADGVEQGHTILDNDKEHLTLTVMDAVGFESNVAFETAAMVFSVQLSHYVYTDVAVTVSTNTQPCDKQPTIACFVDTQGGAQAASADILIQADSNLLFEGNPEAQHGQPAALSVVYNVLNDNVQELDEIMQVSVDTTQTTYINDALSKLTAQGTIVDNEGAQFLFTVEDVEEGADSIFNVAFSHEMATAFAVTYETAAFPQSELVRVETTGTFTLGPLQSTSSFSVETVDNTLLNPEDVFYTVNTVKTEPPISMELNSATAAIVNDDEGAFLEITVAPVDENAVDPVMTFDVALSHRLASGVKVSMETIEISGNATEGLDYTQAATTVSYIGYKREKFSLEVPVLHDNLVEHVEQIGISVKVLSPEYENLITIYENDIGLIVDSEDATITIVDSKTLEGDTTPLTFTVFLSHKVDTNTNFAVDYKVYSDSSDSAASSVDAIVGGLVVGKDFGPVDGAKSTPFVGSEMLINVDVFDDNIVELAELVTLEVSKVPDTMRMENKFAEGVIFDYEDATISIDSVGSHSETVETVDLTVTMSHFTQVTVLVSYETNDGFATSADDSGNLLNQDYIPQQGTVAFESGFDGGVKVQTISVAVVDDEIQEEDYEDFCVTLKSILQPTEVTGAVKIEEDKADGFVLLLNDAEGVTISINDLSLYEGETFEFQPVMSHAVQAADVLVAYTTTAITTDPEGADHEMPSGEVKFPASVNPGKQLSEFIKIETFEDDLDEKDEILEVELTEINGGKPLKGSVSAVDLSPATLALAAGQRHAFGTIYDKDGPLDLGRLYIEDAEADESETFIKFPVLFPRHTENHESITEPITFSYLASSVDARARVGRDYTAETSEGEITIQPGEEVVYIEIALIDDNVVQGDHSFSVLITSDDTPISRNLASGVIHDNDVSEITIGDATATEASGEIIFPVTLTKPVDSGLSFKYETSGNDRGIIQGDEVRLRVEPNTVETSITFSIRNDDIMEPDQVFTILANQLLIQDDAITEVYFSGSAASTSATGTVTDDEHATVSVADTLVDEGAGFLRFPITLSHSMAEGVDAKVRFTVIDITTTEEITERDFRLDTDSNEVSFAATPPGEKPQKDLIFDINDDLIAEPNEMFAVQLERSSALVNLANDIRATVTITDNDFATIAIMDATGEETDERLSFEIVLSHEVSFDVQVSAEALSEKGQMDAPVPQFSVGNVNGLPEYYVADGSLGRTIQPDFQTSTTIMKLSKGSNQRDVVVFDDTEQECDETFLVQLSNLVCDNGRSSCGSVVSVSDDKAMGKLINDDEGLIISVGPHVQHSESFTPFLFEIKMSHAVDHEFELQASVVSTPESISRLEACAGLPPAECTRATQEVYTVRMHLPAIANNARTWYADYAVAVLEDEIAQAPGNFTVQLTSGYELLCGRELTLSPGTGVIVSDENPVLEVVSFKALEDNTAEHNMIVKLDKPIELPLTVGYKIVDGTAADFDKLEGTFTFPPRSTAQEVSVPLAVRADKRRVEKDETYLIELTDVPDWLSARSGTFTIIDDEIKGSDIVVSPATIVEGGFLEFEISLEGGEHESAITFNVVTRPGSARSGRHFQAVQTQLRWERGQTQTQVVRVKTKAKPGCTPNLDMKLKLFNLHGPGRFESRNKVEFATGTILDSSSTTVSVHAPAFIIAGQSGIFKGSLSDTCSFAVTVPVTIDGESEKCTIPAGMTTCDIVIGTRKKDDKVIAAEVDSATFADSNPDYNSLVDGTVRETTVGKQTANSQQVAAAYACGPLVSATSFTRGEVALVSGIDYTTELDISACFIDAESIDVDITNSVEVRRNGDVLSLTAPSAGTSTLTLTGTTSSGSSGVVTLELRANTKAAVPLTNLADGITIPVGGVYQALVGGVVNDDEIGNIDSCEITDGVTESLTDCCVVDTDLLTAHTCERVVPNARQTRIESVRVNIQAEASGTSTVCLGTFSDFTTDPRQCFEVTVPKELNLRAPATVTADSGTIEMRLGRGTYDILAVAGASSWSKKGRTLTASVPDGVSAVHVMARDEYGYVATAEVTVVGARR